MFFSHCWVIVLCKIHNSQSYWAVSFDSLLVMRFFFLFVKASYVSNDLVKLDEVGPVDNRPSTNRLHHFVRKKKNCDIWHVTCDTWHVTCDMWHVTCDLFKGVNILSKFQLPSSYCLWFMILWRSGGKGTLTDWFNELMNYKAVYRTAPATPCKVIFDNIQL